MLRFWLGWPVLRRDRWKRSALALLLYRGSCVDRFEAEVIDIWLRLGPWVLLPRGLAVIVVISWSIDHLGLDSTSLLTSCVTLSKFFTIFVA